MLRVQLEGKSIRMCHNWHTTMCTVPAREKVGMCRNLLVHSACDWRSRGGRWNLNSFLEPQPWPKQRSDQSVRA